MLLLPLLVVLLLLLMLFTAIDDGTMSSGLKTFVELIMDGDDAVGDVVSNVESIFFLLEFAESQFCYLLN